MSKSRLAITLTAIVAATIMVAAAFVFGGGKAPIPRILPGLALLSEVANTPTPTRVSATATPQSSLAMVSGQHVLVSCPSNLSLAQNDLSCLVGQSSPTPIPSTMTPQATVTVGPSATDTPTAFGTSPTSVPSNTPTATPTPFATSTPTPVVATYTPAPTSTGLVGSGPVHYVSKLGNNSDGNSLANAWNELNQINWSVVRPGDTVLLAAGTYTTELQPTASGTAAAPIKILANGQVTIFGGRSTALPYCDQPTYTYQNTGVLQTGVDLGTSYVTLDGGQWKGILITGTNNTGLHISGSHNIARNLEITDNGTADLKNGVWRPNQQGVIPGGSDNTLDRDIIHDNGQDSAQSGTALTNFSITNSWLYNARPHPVHGAAVPFNFCTHSDGLQIWNGTSTGINITNSILGPGHMQGTILGQIQSATGVVNNVHISNVLNIGNFNAGFMGYAGSHPTGWVIDHATIYTARSVDWNSGPGGVPGTGWNSAISLDGANHRITNTIAYDGRVDTAGTTFAGNCQYSLISGTIGGVVANPQFASPPPMTTPFYPSGNGTSPQTAPTMAQFIAADYTPSGSCAGMGSSLTSVAQLLAQ